MTDQTPRSNMMSQPKHTPTPWFLAKKNRFAIDAKSEGGEPGEDYRIAKLHTSPFSPAKDVCEANARLIVAAVNAHALLVAELEETIRWLETQAAAIERIGNEYGKAVADKTRAAASRLRGRADQLRATLYVATGDAES